MRGREEEVSDWSLVREQAQQEISKVLDRVLMI